MPTLASATAAVTACTDTTPGGAAAREHTLAHLERHGDAALTRAIPEHLTASTLVLDPTLARTLLCFHRKGRFWVQPGGHMDAADGDPRTAALRELAEETGLRHPRRVLHDPVDIDRHALGDGFGTCAWHIDLGYAVVADPGPVVVSDESTDVAWWPVADLPHDLADSVAERVARAAAALRAAVVAPRM